MFIDNSTNRLVTRHDFTHLSILLTIAFAVGVYLIATTVLIAKDGVLYIEQAQQFPTNPIRTIKYPVPFGYPFLIFIVHKLFALFSNGPSVYAWIYPAQIVNLLCRILSLIPLYLIGKALVGSRNSFWALLILIFLPYPAKFGSDVLRDWPHMMFLAAGFLFLLWGGNQGVWWMFGVAGLAAGLGYFIRPVCGQLIVYGMAWLTYCLVRPTRTMNRSRATLAVVLLLLGFMIPVGPYARIREDILPHKARQLINSFSFDGQSNESKELNVGIDAQLVKESVACDSKLFANAFYNIYKDIGESLMWIFAIPWLIGIFQYFRASHTNKGKFLMLAFIGANIVFLVLRATHFDKAISKRYVLPLIAFTIFYIPVGLEILSCKISRRKRGDTPSGFQKQMWFHALIIVGLCVCMPKLFRPIGADKFGYRRAAEWLNKNTSKDIIIAVPDRRISFYAERKGTIYEKTPAGQVRYIVKIVSNENIEESVDKAVQKKFSVRVDRRKNNAKKLVIYEVL
jgi:hypothetical protein